MGDDRRLPETLRVAQVAKLLNVPRSTAYSWVKRGMLPAIRVGKVVLVRLSDLESFLASHKVPKVKEMQTQQKRQAGLTSNRY